jgi:hypothetical protein
MVSPGAKGCLPNANATVIDHTFGNFENLEVVVHSADASSAATKANDFTDLAPCSMLMTETIVTRCINGGLD